MLSRACLFWQPEHKIPTDFQRYTRDGLELLFTNAGFMVEDVRPIFTVYHSLHWLTYEWLHMRDAFIYKALRLLLLPTLVILSRRSALVSDNVASVFRLVARKACDVIGVRRRCNARFTSSWSIRDCDVTNPVVGQNTRQPCIEGKLSELSESP